MLDNLSKTTVKNIDILEFKEISFTYPGSNDCIFSNLNLKLLKGNYYAIVGESGTGKTTFLNILSGLNDDFEGEFLIDGQKFEMLDLKNFFGSALVTYLKNQLFLMVQLQRMLRYQI